MAKSLTFLRPYLAGPTRGAIVVAITVWLLPGIANALTPAGSALVNSATTPNQQSMALSVANLCPQMSVLFAQSQSSPRLSAAEQELFYRCREILNSTSGSASAKPDILEQLTSDELTAGQRATLTYSNAQRVNIASRLLVLRRGSGATMAANGQDLDWQGTLGGAAGDDTGFSDGRLGIYLNGSVGSGDKDKTDFEAGYDVDTQSLTAGMDYRISDGFVAGAAIGYGTSEADYFDGGRFDSDGISGSLYASFYGDRFYLNVLGEYGQVDHDLDRVIDYSLLCSPCTNQPTGGVAINTVASGSTSSDVLTFGVDFGYELTDGPFSFTPMAAVKWVQVDLDGFSESNAGVLNELALVYDDQTANSLEFQLGFSAGYNWSSSWGVLSPYGRVMVVQETRDSKQSFDAHYLFDPCFETTRCTSIVTDPSATDLSIESDRPDSGFYRWALGVSAVFANGFAAFAEYEGLEDYDTVSFGVATVGLRYQFR